MRTSVRATVLAVAAAAALVAAGGAAHAQGAGQNEGKGKGPGGASCDLKSLQVTSDGVVISYDPFDRNGDQTQIPLRLNADGCQNARLELVVVPELDSLSSSGGLQATNSDQGLPVELTLDNAPMRVVANAVNAFDVTPPALRLAGNSGQVQGQGLRVELPYGAEVAPGRYRARATLVARVIGEDGEPSDTITAPFFVEVDVQASFRLAAGVERARLWLGELTEGERSQPLTFLAFSNTRYALKIRSEHGGRMTLNGSDGRNAPGVPYDLRISDRELNWTDGEGELRFPRPNFLLRTHEVVAVTGEVDIRRPAGDYKDWVTVEISPLIS